MLSVRNFIIRAWEGKYVLFFLCFCGVFSFSGTRDQLLFHAWYANLLSLSCTLQPACVCVRARACMHACVSASVSERLGKWILIQTWVASEIGLPLHSLSAGITSTTTHPSKVFKKDCWILILFTVLLSWKECFAEIDITVWFRVASSPHVSLGSDSQVLGI